MSKNFLIKLLLIIILANVLGVVFLVLFKKDILDLQIVINVLFVILGLFGLYVIYKIINFFTPKTREFQSTKKGEIIAFCKKGFFGGPKYQEISPNHNMADVEKIIQSLKNKQGVSKEILLFTGFLFSILVVSGIFIFWIDASYYIPIGIMLVLLIIYNILLMKTEIIVYQQDNTDDKAYYFYQKIPKSQYENLQLGDKVNIKINPDDEADYEIIF